jgi:CzcA family heavy metal efflux pump
MQDSGSFIDRIILWSIERRLLVVLAAVGILLYGGWTALRMPVDVFPDLSAPTVTVVTEAHGLAPQEVETLVTFPIEASVNGATGVRRVRSNSGTGISLVWVEFDWGTDIYRARQIVAEKLQSANLGKDMGTPTLAPISSIMGEILFVGLASETQGPMELRDIAQWEVRRRLKSLAGVAHVIVMGGDLKQFQVLVNPEKLLQHELALADVVSALSTASENSTGGFLVQGAQESVVRGLGRVGSVEDIEGLVVAMQGEVPITLGQVANVQIGATLKRGEGSINAKPGVVIGVLKQPGENTIELTKRIDKELTSITEGLPKGTTIKRDLLRQADFIETSVDNVSVALRDGAILVALILFLFLWNWRTTLISLAAMPMSLALAIIVMHWMELTINTMTLGGLTIAIGAIVDDAIIDVENVFRRLRERRERRELSEREADQVIYKASREIRQAIVFATLIVGLVYLPLFFLGGVEGRLLVPLGISYLVALVSSLFVALTLTPALCSYILGRVHSLAEKESALVRGLKAAYQRPLRLVVQRPRAVVTGSAVLLAATAALMPFLGRAFLPEFNEGALTVSAVTLPGTSLETSNRLGRQVEEALLEFPEVVSTARRTGRSELDEHAQEIYAAEIDVRLSMKDRGKEEFLSEVRSSLGKVSGIAITVGQPISHRIDHMLSGTRAAIAIKIFGDDLGSLRSAAEQVKATVEGVSGAVDVAIEQPIDVPQLLVRFKKDELRRYGATPGVMAEALERAFTGTVATHVIEGQRSYEVLVKYDQEGRGDVKSMEETLLDTPVGIKVPLRMLAHVGFDAGPSTISRENAQRKLVVMANVSGRDLGSVVDDIRKAVDEKVTFPRGVYPVYGGQFESEQAARSRITLLGGLVIVGIFVLLVVALRSPRLAILTMANLPLAFIGGVVAVFAGGGIVTVGSLIGFVTLFGIATRNGLIMITHYEHLLLEEGADLAEAVERGSMEKLSPVLMTALSAALALVPLVLAGNQPGNEIQAPMGVVILGGLLTSTLLNLIVVPALYARFGRPAEEVVPEAS